MDIMKNIVYIIKKIFILVISIFILSIGVFYMSRLAPGDPLISYYGDSIERMSTEEKTIAREELGLNEPIYIQYSKWGQAALKGDLGLSFKYKDEVINVISSRIGNTLVLGGISFLIIFILGLLLAIVCTYYENSKLDNIICKVGELISVIPEFWISLILILILSVNFKVLPSSGAYTIGVENSIVDRIIHLILPVFVVVSSHLWYYTYIFRNRLIEETRQEYTLLAKAKGISKSRIVCNQCLRNIIPTYISTMAISIPHILGGTYIVEAVFSYPGMGMLAFESAKYHDYNLVMIIAIITGVVTILCNMIAGVINERINPMLKEYS